MRRREKHGESKERKQEHEIEAEKEAVREAKMQSGRKGQTESQRKAKRRGGMERARQSEADIRTYKNIRTQESARGRQACARQLL